MNMVYREQKTKQTDRNNDLHTCTPNSKDDLQCYDATVEMGTKRVKSRSQKYERVLNKTCVPCYCCLFLCFLCGFWVDLERLQ